MCRSVANGQPERVEDEDVLRASILLDYFKNHARRVYVGLHGSDRLDLLAADVATFLENQNGYWRGQPSELNAALKSEHKPKEAKDLSKDLVEISQRSGAIS